jgi:WD40 repeat protein
MSASPAETSRGAPPASPRTRSRIGNWSRTLGDFAPVIAFQSAQLATLPLCNEQVTCAILSEQSGPQAIVVRICIPLYCSPAIVPSSHRLTILGGDEHACLLVLCNPVCNDASQTPCNEDLTQTRSAAWWPRIIRRATGQSDRSKLEIRRKGAAGALVDQLQFVSSSGSADRYVTRLAYVTSVFYWGGLSAMATPVSHFDTGHTDTVHDSQFDYYGQRLATCSSDGVVRIFSVDQDPAQYVADLTGHQGPVWQVAWGHPKFGSIVASAGFDHTVILWKEDQDGSWYILHRTDANLHTGRWYRRRDLNTTSVILTSPIIASPSTDSVHILFMLRHLSCTNCPDQRARCVCAGSINSVSFAPAELGLIFAAASSDGNLSVHTSNVETGEWLVALVQNEGGLPAHPLGATCVSFAPALEPGALTSSRTRQARTLISKHAIPFRCLFRRRMPAQGLAILHPVVTYHAAHCSHTT